MYKKICEYTTIVMSIVGTFCMIGAAGAIEAIYSIKAVQTGEVPPTLNLNDPEDGLAGFDLVPLEAKRRRVRNAMSNSFGFGGTNGTLIFTSL